MTKTKDAPVVEDDLFTEDNVPASSFVKFKKVGDRFSGELVEVKDKDEKPPFPAQRVYVLKQKDGSLINVGIPLNKDYVIGRANTAKMGDILGFEFKKEIPAKTPGFAAAKSIEVYVRHVERADEEAS
jgi:hypothetical protein